MQERRQKIVEFVNQLGTVSFAQLMRRSLRSPT